jgi:hypothetical protein
VHTGAKVGVYSTPLMWQRITGGWQPGLPAWLALGSPGADPASRCGTGFTAGPVAMVQWVAGDRDVDLACPWTAADAEVLRDQLRKSWGVHHR